MKLWDWEDETLVREIEGASLVGFHPSGSAMMVVSGSRAEIVESETRRLIATLVTQSGEDISSLAFAPGGSVVATGHVDGAVRLFDADTGAQQLALPRHACAVMDLAFSPDGAKLASTSCDGVRVWAMDVDDLLEIARQNVTRPLTEAECLQYLHTDRCPSRPDPR